MEDKMQVFMNPEFGSIRILDKDGEPWFVGKDVAAALGYGAGKSLANAVAKHVDAEDKGVIDLMTPGGKQRTGVINETGLYSLVLSSKLESARKFKRWVTKDVLPSIRKHGAYMTPETLQEAILNPDVMIQLCQKLKSEQEKNKVLEEKNAELTPKAEFADAITASEDSVPIMIFAKILNQNGIRINGKKVGQNILFEYLRNKGFLSCMGGTYWNTPCQKYVNSGYFQVSQRIRSNGQYYYKTSVTPAGQKFFIKYFKKLMKNDGDNNI